MYPEGLLFNTLSSLCRSRLQWSVGKLRDTSTSAATPSALSLAFEALPCLALPYSPVPCLEFKTSFLLAFPGLALTCLLLVGLSRPSPTTRISGAHEAA